MDWAVILPHKIGERLIMSENKHTPDYLINPTSICGCTIDISTKAVRPLVLSIRYCAKHAAAPELLAALQTVLSHHRVVDISTDTFDDRREVAYAAILKATNQE